MRTYQKTHPWLTFKIDLRNAPTALWINLGECKSKCEHIAGVPLRPNVAKYLHRLYLAKGVLATTAIEGNTLSEEEVLKFLDGKLELPPSREYLAQEIDNIIQACNMITQEIVDEMPASCSVERIKLLNKMALKDLKLDEVVPGEVRKYSVGVARYRGAPPEDCEYLLGELCRWLNSEDFKNPLGQEIVLAIIKSVICHLYLAWIHPFGDGNGRTARLMEFQILIGSGVPAPAAQLLSNHYNQTRSEYYRQLHEASKSGGDIIPFLSYAVEGFLDGLIGQLKIIGDQQWDIVWRNYVHELLKDKISSGHYRRLRDLLLDISRKEEPVKISEILMLTPRITLAYSKKSGMTLNRDINKLIQMELLEKTEKGLRARKEIILSFLPVKAENKLIKG